MLLGDIGVRYERRFEGVDGDNSSDCDRFFVAESLRCSAASFFRMPVRFLHPFAALQTVAAVTKLIGLCEVSILIQSIRRTWISESLHAPGKCRAKLSICFWDRLSAFSENRIVKEAFSGWPL